MIRGSTLAANATAHSEHLELHCGLLVSSKADQVVESLGATCTIPGATTISSDLTGCRDAGDDPRARPHDRSLLEERHFMG
jgi:hypothetical protein